MSPALLEALRHPLRRQILRELHDSDVAISPAQFAGIFSDWEISAVAFHFRVLEKMRIVRCKETKRVRGSTEHLFVSQVKKNQLVSAILKETEKVDGRLLALAG
jgi:DNA-binding transcriptional ArsR family regulator